MEAEPPRQPSAMRSHDAHARSPRMFAAAIAIALMIHLASAVTYLVTGPVWVTAAKTAGTGHMVRPDLRLVDAVLARRSRAVRERDRGGFLATVTSASPAFRSGQERLFGNLLELPLAGWQEHVHTARPLAAGSGGFTFRVITRYRLRGFDLRDISHTRYLTFGHRSGTGWVITGDGTAQGLLDDPEIWDVGRLLAVRGRHSLAIGNYLADGDRPRMRMALREIVRRLDAAVPVVTGIVGTGWHRRVVAFVPAWRSQAERLAGGGQDLARIAALATTSGGTANGSDGPDRIIISPGTFGRLTAFGRSVVLTHELTHVATGGARDGRTPIWLVEGLADYVAYKGTGVGPRSAARELRAEVIAGRLPAALPGADDFGSGSARLPQAYEEAWLACRMVADHYGEHVLLRLYQVSGVRREAVFREVLGIDPVRFTALWRDYLREELR